MTAPVVTLINPDSGVSVTLAPSGALYLYPDGKEVRTPLVFSPQRDADILCAKLGFVREKGRERP